MPSIEVSNETKRAIALAARVAGVTEGEVVRRLIVGSPLVVAKPETPDEQIPIFADYAGFRARAWYTPPGRVEIIDGPLQGTSHKTPSGAARALVRHYNPSVNDNRNGWTLWRIDDGGTCPLLQSIRP